MGHHKKRATKYIKVGEIFKYGNTYYECIDDVTDQEVCKSCAFQDNRLCHDLNCSWITRADCKNVYFIRVEKPAK